MIDFPRIFILLSLQGPASLNFIRLLRVVITPSVVERRKRLEAIDEFQAKVQPHLPHLQNIVNARTSLSQLLSFPRAIFALMATVETRM